MSEDCATSCLCGFIAISRHVFYLLKTAIIFYLVFVCRFTPRCFFLFKTTFISLAFCPFTARFFVSVQNCNYVPLTFCRFTPRCFFLFKTTFISLAFCPFTARFFVSVQNCNYVPLTFCRFTARCFYLFKTAIIFCLVFVCRFTALFCLFNICAVQNNVLCCSKQCKVQ